MQWSLDLIGGLPSLTEQMWEHSLKEAIKAAPHHISVYDLQASQGPGTSMAGQACMHQPGSGLEFTTSMRKC